MIIISLDLKKINILSQIFIEKYEELRMRFACKFMKKVNIPVFLG